ncbi:nuclease-related domain-containing protein [Flammeovirga pacifica]|uniref:NERD domain-containing protein n=1 Tax=Flammeovirga pacifica TaxID=915059 RepID=A0A1S1YSW4_FLAPC|nr:nuclease-related domain-containing protein [Flammeovirga pacifica]OHX64124.1 hypothetical protein NH26_21190 [Flammeovirga pacifica]
MNKTKLLVTLESLIERSSFNDFTLFLKAKSPFKNKKISKTFYEFDFPPNYINILSQTDVWDDILYYYFSSGTNANLNFLKAVVDIDFKYLQGFILLYESYHYSYHWSTFKSFKSSHDINQRQFYKKLQFLKDNKDYWQDSYNFFQDEIIKYSYEDIIIQVISLFQKFKNYSPETINNNSVIISYRIQLIRTLNKFITAKRECDEQLQPKYTIETFSKILNQELPPIRPEEYFVNNCDPKFLPREDVSEIKEQIRAIINFQFGYIENENKINYILTGNADFEVIDGNEADILTNKRFLDHQTNLQKHKYLDWYLEDKVKEEYKDELKALGKDQWAQEYYIKKYSCLEYFNFFNIPFLFDSDAMESKVDFNKVILLLQVFSVNLFPQGRFFNIIGKTVDSIYKRELETKFKNVFSNTRQIDYVSVFEKNELIDNCVQYFKWSKEDVISIINYLSIDLNSTKKQLFDIQTSPFIKIGENYFWLSALNKDIKWEVALHRRLIRDNKLEHNRQTEYTEAYVAELFESAGFKTQSSHKYSYCIDSKTKIAGDIDTLAYKDKTLFIVEVKNTYIEENHKREQKYVIKNFKIHAVNQLKKAEKYIRENFDNLNKELKIDCSLDELNIQPLIVSNVYIGDENIYYNKYLKLSLFELMIHLKKGEINENLCSPSYIISAIKENEIWGNLKNENNDIHQFSISEYDQGEDYIS